MRLSYGGIKERGSFVLRSGAVAGRVPDKGNNTKMQDWVR